MNSSHIDHEKSNLMLQLKQIEKVNAFFKAWKTAIKLLDPIFFLSDELSLTDTVCTMDLKPNIAVIETQISNLRRDEQHFICFLICLYDAEKGKNLSKYIGFDFFRDFVNFDDVQKQLIAELIKNFSQADEFWGDFVN